MSNKKRGKKVEVNDDLEDIDMNDVTDSEEEYTETEKSLLKNVRTRRTSEDYDSDDEVYGLQDDEDNNDKEISEQEDEADSMESDIEGLQDDYDLPDERAWGKKKRAYYSTDYVDPDYASASQKDLAEAEIEEQEARSIQKRLIEQLDDADFGLDFVQPKKDDEETHEDVKEIIKTDLSKLSKRQKQAIMQKESPEFLALVNDFKDRMVEARDILAPFLKLVKKGLLPDCTAVSFVKTKYHLALNYCVNISFYLMLKAKRLPVNSHPVIKRLAQYRQLLNQLESGQESLMKEIQEILNAERNGKPLYNTSDGSKVCVDKPKKVSKVFAEKVKVKRTKQIAKVPDVQLEEELMEEEEEEELQSDEHEDYKELEDTKDEEEAEEAEVNAPMETDGKRGITYQIAKNKGLTPHRKKELRNPRVKHRNKYRKAKIRRKGAVREVRKEITRYAGEISGIKASVKKSIKLK